MLAQAKRRYKLEGLDYDIEDPRLLQIEELASQGSLFPPIQSTSFGKATNHLIKSLLNNFPSNMPQNRENT